MSKLALLLAALLLVQGSAAEHNPACTLSPPCNHIYLGLAPVFPPDAQGSWFFICHNANGPWMLVYGTGWDPTAYPKGTWKGCDFWPFGALTLIGPLTGDMHTTFVPPGPMFPGCWQIISATQTSNPVCAP